MNPADTPGPSWQECTFSNWTFGVNEMSDYFQYDRMKHRRNPPLQLPAIITFLFFFTPHKDTINFIKCQPNPSISDFFFPHLLSRESETDDMWQSLFFWLILWPETWVTHSFFLWIFPIEQFFSFPRSVFSLEFSLRELVGDVFEPSCSFTCFYVEFHVILYVMAKNGQTREKRGLKNIVSMISDASVTITCSSLMPFPAAFQCMRVRHRVSDQLNTSLRITPLITLLFVQSHCTTAH